MRIDIITTGDELRTGSVIDTNSSYISAVFENRGYTICRHITVGDDVHILAHQMKETAGLADICIMTGGLGPTEDDVTSEASAFALGCQLHQDPSAEESVRSYFKKLNREPGVSDKKQWVLPEKAVCIENPYGTAPGFKFILNNCCFYILPGVPEEMKKMLENHVIPDVNFKFSNMRTFTSGLSVTLFGISESEAGEFLSGFTESFPDHKLGFRVSFPLIYLNLYSVESVSGSTADVDMEASLWIHNRVGKWIISENGLTLEEEVGRKLVQNQSTIAIAESCTGGLIAHMLTDVAGSSDYFLFSGVTYSNEAKTKILGVHPDTIIKNGAVHEETVKQMAAGARIISGATYGLSTSGIAGPGGGSEEKPVGTVCIGLASQEKIRAYRFVFSSNDRHKNKKLFACKALELILNELK